MIIQTKSLSVRVKDKHAKVLRQMAFEVNQVFNLANELSMTAYRNYSDQGPIVPAWLSAFDIQKKTAGIQKECGFKIGSAAQRANKKARVRSIHAKIRNRRKDTIHKFTTALANNHAAIFVGDVSSSRLAKTKMAKSVLDAGWAMLKTQLEYKAIGRSVVYEVVNESNSTQTCSCCGTIPSSSPKGRAGLRIEGAAQVMDLFKVRS